MESCWSNQLWSGFGPLGTSLRDTEWTSLILLLLDSEALKMAERACRNVEECLVSDPCSISPFPIDRLISRQVVPWTSTRNTIRKMRNSWEFLFFMMWMVGIERLIDGIMDFYRRRNKAVFLFLCLVRQVLQFIYRGAMSIVRPGLFFFNIWHSYIINPEFFKYFVEGTSGLTLSNHMLTFEQVKMSLNFENYYINWMCVWYCSM